MKTKKVKRKAPKIGDKASEDLESEAFISPFGIYGDLGLWTVEETAKILGVSVRLVRNLLKAGKFPHAKRVGKPYRIPKSDVIEWLTKGS